MKPLFNKIEPVKYFWKDLLLTASKDDTQKIDLSSSYSLEKALAYFSENLNFMNRLEVLNKVKTSKKVDFEEYFSNLNMRFDSNLHEKIFNKVKVWPKEFVNWASEKDLNPKDFRVFLNTESENIFKLLSLVVKVMATKSNGLRIIDLSLDLLAHNKVTFEELNKFTSDQKLLKFLNKKRFSQTIKNDEDLNNRFLKVDLIKDAKVSTFRSGDHNEIKLEVNALNPEDLIKKLDKIKAKIDEIETAWIGD